jgi:hypothetical protein
MQFHNLNYSHVHVFNLRDDLLTTTFLLK